MKRKVLIPLVLVSLFTLGGCDGTKPTQPIDGTSSTEPIHTHSYDASKLTWDWQPSSTGYDVTATFKCLECDESVTVDAIVDVEETKQATCTVDGEKKYTAVAFMDGKEYKDEKIVSVAAKGHRPASEWTKTPTHHYYECEYCGEHLEEGEHVWTDWVVTDEADYGHIGSRQRECTICGYVATEEIPALVPTVAQVNEAMDKAVAGKFPYSHTFINEAIKLYSYLPESDQATIAKYEQVKTLQDTFNASYEVVSNSLTRVVQKKDSEALGYAGNWEGDLSKSVDASYGNVDVLDIKTVSDGWGDQHLNGISFMQEIPDFTKYKTYSFGIYNPAEGNSTIMLFTKGWYRIPNESTMFTLLPGWNEMNVTVKDGAYNGSQGKTDATLEGFTILLANNQVNDGWMISDFIGVKSSQEEIDNVINLINQISSPVTEADKDKINAARSAYELLTDYAKNLVTNYDALVTAENAYSAFAADETIALINAIPTTLDKFASFKALDAVEASYSALTPEAQAKVSNYAKYETAKAEFDAKYLVVHNPRIHQGVEGGAAAGSTVSISYENNEVCGPAMRVDATSTAGDNYFQAYLYGFNGATFGANDIIEFMVYSPFETVSGTSQTYWADAYPSAAKFNLTAKEWTTISGTGASFNSNGNYATNLSTGSFINLQRYANPNVLTEAYSGAYYVSAIIATRV